MKAEQAQGTTAEADIQTTEETTEERTTEDLGTTFEEDETRTIYDGLYRDSNGDYPYEIASYTTHYDSSNTTRTSNLKASVKSINNIVVPKDCVFSFNQIVGKRTVTAGYDTAKIIVNNEFVDGLGGGVCQVSSTIFECVLRANVEIVERSNHSLVITYTPLGGDAAVQWNTQDFQFKNTLNCNVRLSMSCGDGSLTCKLFADKKVDVGNVKIDISGSGMDYTLVRYVNGKKNYSTNSHYQEQKTTKKQETTKKKKN